MGAHGSAKRAVAVWHEAVNASDLSAAREVLADPVVVNGPKGGGSISAAEFVEWISRSGIRMTPRSHHRVSDSVLVVEQDARWPQDEESTRVATVFRVHGERVSAALRFPALSDTLKFASLYREMLTTEPGPQA